MILGERSLLFVALGFSEKHIRRVNCQENSF